MAASYGCAVFVSGGQRFYKDLYFDDTANNPVRWDGGAGASTVSPTDWKVPSACTLVDVCIASATGQTKTNVCRNDSGTGTIVRNSIHLSTITFRPMLGVPFGAGDKVSFVQLA